jgi:hypothetical protein
MEKRLSKRESGRAEAEGRRQKAKGKRQLLLSDCSPALNSFEAHAGIDANLTIKKTGTHLA